MNQALPGSMYDMPVLEYETLPPMNFIHYFAISYILSVDEAHP